MKLIHLGLLCSHVELPSLQCLAQFLFQDPLGCQAGPSGFSHRTTDMSEQETSGMSEFTSVNQMHMHLSEIKAGFVQILK